MYVHVKIIGWLLFIFLTPLFYTPRGCNVKWHSKILFSFRKSLSVIIFFFFFFSLFFFLIFHSFLNEYLVRIKCVLWPRNAMVVNLLRLETLTTIQVLLYILIQTGCCMTVVGEKVSGNMFIIERIEIIWLWDIVHKFRIECMY